MALVGVTMMTRGLSDILRQVRCVSHWRVVVFHAYKHSRCLRPVRGASPASANCLQPMALAMTGCNGRRCWTLSAGARRATMDALLDLSDIVVMTEVSKQHAKSASPPFPPPDPLACTLC